MEENHSIEQKCVLICFTMLCASLTQEELVAVAV